ncbi:hypothetical protein J3A83DRAFT_4187912 [Scleroderma citrinum]
MYQGSVSLLHPILESPLVILGCSSIASIFSLIAKYQHHALHLRSTGEGIDPNNSNYQTLQEKICAEFLFWEDCHWMWHGNPAYSAKVFNAAPGANQVEHFLSIANDCTSAMSAASTQHSGQAQSNNQHDDMVGEHSRGEAAQLEEEEPECNDVKCDAEMSGGLQDWQDGPSALDQLPVNVMSIDG